MPQTGHYEMKDSGVEWIGKIPIGWKVIRNKVLFEEVNERCGASSNLTLLSVSEYYGVAPRAEKIAEDEMLTRAESLEGYKICHKNDIVMNIMLAWKRSQGVSQYDGIVSPAYCVFRRKDDAPIDMRYIHYLIRTDRYADEYKCHSTGIIDSRLRLYPDKFLALESHVPPLSEQTAIAAYLDEKCATIDAIIAEAKSSIEEYKSWKASVIFETVTKGLNPNAEMKDSGVEWIGEIPKGWKVSAVKRHYSITLGKMLESVPQSNDATLENYMCASNVKWGGIDTTTNRQMWFSPVEKEEYLLKEGDLLVMEGGATAGTSTIYHGEFTPCYMQNSVNRCRSKDGSLPTFLYYWLFLVNHRGHIDSVCNCATFKHLTKEKLGRIPFVYVPKEEQASIVSYLDRKCSLIDGVIAEKEELIRELENYKRSLIFEAVTGKRRVC